MPLASTLVGSKAASRNCRRNIASVPVKVDSGRSLRVCSNRNASTFTVAKRDRKQKIATKTDTKIFCLVSVHLPVGLAARDFGMLNDMLMILDFSS